MPAGCLSGANNALRPTQARGNCATCPLIPRTVWHGLDTAALEFLGRHHVRREYGAGEAVFSMGEAYRGMYCISAGTVGLRKLDAHGNSILLRMGYPGDTLGYRAMIKDRRHQTSCEALGPSYVCFFERPVIEHLLAERPQLGMQFLRHASDELDRAYDSIFKSAVMSNRGRFVLLLTVLAERHADVHDDGSRTITLPFGRRDLASMIGTRHETLSRIISRLESDGLAEFSGRCVRIPTMAPLHAETEVAGSA